MANSPLEELRNRMEELRGHFNYLREVDAKGLEEIWNAYCGHLDPKMVDDKEYAARIGQTAQEKEQEIIEAAQGMAENAIQDAVQLQQDPDTDIAQEASEILKVAQKYERNIERFQNGIVARGVNHPFTQWAVDYGKRMHEKLEDECGEDPKAKDQPFPGLRGRPDLVTIERGVLTVYEFKPMGEEDLGRDQVAGYLEGVATYYQSFFEDGLHGGFKDISNPPPDDKGGQAMLDKLKSSPYSWESDGSTLRALGTVKTYDPCEDNPYGSPEIEE
jgi:hypothetical protein